MRGYEFYEPLVDDVLDEQDLERAYWQAKMILVGHERLEPDLDEWELTNPSSSER